MSLTIRPVQKGEAALVLSLVRELAEYKNLSSEVDATVDLLDDALFRGHSSIYCDFAEWNGDVVGFALYFLNFSSFRGRNGLYLEDLFVRQSHREKGIGRAMLQHLADRCVSEGWTRFEWNVLDWNSPAIEFYKSCGATLMTEWTTCRVTGENLRQLAKGNLARGKT